MPEISTLKHIADIVLNRLLADHAQGDLAEALERAYPFGDHPDGRQIWLEAMLRHAVKFDRQRHEDLARKSPTVQACRSLDTGATA